MAFNEEASQQPCGVQQNKRGVVDLKNAKLFSGDSQQLIVTGIKTVQAARRKFLHFPIISINRGI